MPEEPQNQSHTEQTQERSAGAATKTRTSQSSLGIPIAIVIAAGLIASAIYFGGGNGPAATTNEPGSDQTTPEVTTVPIQEDDHVRGNPNAPIVLIEYSDYDCPFCKRFHDTMNRIINEYGPTGDVAWVYRHLPLESLHPNAPLIARASECVAEQTGNDGFWTFTDLVFDERATNELTDPARLPEFAETAGADPAQFQECIDSNTYQEEVQADFEEAIAANGGTQGLGTPFTLVFVGNEYVGPISGAQPYDVVKRNIDTILSQIQGGNAEAAAEDITQ